MLLIKEKSVVLANVILATLHFHVQVETNEIQNTVDTGRKLNVHKTFRERLMYVQFTLFVFVKGCVHNVSVFVLINRS